MKADPDTLATLQLLESKVADLQGKTSGGAGGIFFQQGGNSFGATAVLGTNDAQSLQLRTNGITLATLTSAGAITLTGTATSAISTTVGNLNLTGQVNLNLNGTTGQVAIGAASTAVAIGGAGITTTINGPFTVAGPGAITLGASAASSFTTSIGAITIDSVAALNLGTTNTTSIVIGSANVAALSLTTAAGVIATTATAIAGGGAIPATLNYIIVTINGTARKIPFAAT